MSFECFEGYVCQQVHIITHNIFLCPVSEWGHSDFTTSFTKNIKPPLLIFASILLHVRFKCKVIPKIGLVLGFHLTHLYFRNALTSNFNLHNAHACKHRVFQNAPKVHPLCKGTSKTLNFIYCKGLLWQTSCIFNIQYKIVSTFGKQTNLLFSSYNDCLSNL